MADTKISDLTAVTTPASTDEFAVNQGGTSKKQTRAQLHTLEAGERLIIQKGSAAAPEVAFGDGNTGFFEVADNILDFVTAGVGRFRLSSSGFASSAAGGAILSPNPSSSTAASVRPNSADVDTGLGAAALDQLSLIAGAVEGQRISEASSAVLHSYQADSGLTAHTDSVQGAGVILSSYNVYSTVANAGDAATLPAAFLANPAMVVHIKNNGANSMDVFPASGDDAGAGADTAVAVAAGDFAVFMATADNATWTKIMGGTA